MLMPTSSEFVTLCRSQVALLTQVLGATLTVIYLTEELIEGAETRLVPIVAWPETALIPERSGRMTLVASPEALAQALPKRLAAAEPPAPAIVHHAVPLPQEPEPVLPPQQLVVPLVHEGMMLGLLVTERDNRAWSEWDRNQIDRIAQTLALSCMLDQRAQWLHQTQHQQHLMQVQQHDLMDNLLHQFRNPLTALRTFGKLLLKRLQPGENNYEVAASMVRESDRLQALLKQFDQAIDLPDLANLPLELAPLRSRTDSTPTAAAPALLPPGVLTVQHLQLAPCTVIDVLTPLLISTTAIAQEKGLLIRTAIAPHLPLVWANAAALCEVLSNLLDNAVKYTPRDGQIHIRVAGPDDLDAFRRLPMALPTADFPLPERSVMIAISDTGVGIPAQDLPHLFERHYRGVQAAGQIPGTGLGLAIARSLVQQMQGDIQVICPLAAAGWVGDDPPQLARGTTIAVWLAGVQGEG